LFSTNITPLCGLNLGADGTFRLDGRTVILACGRQVCSKFIEDKILRCRWYILT